MSDRLTEDEVVLNLVKLLKRENWHLDSYCLSHQRGFDLVLHKDDHKMIIEAKGSMANKKSVIKKRKYFDSGQLKTHFGKAIVKCMEARLKFPNAI